MGQEGQDEMTRPMDRVVLDGGRAWWDDVSQHESDPFAMDGYGQLAAAGGEALLRTITEDVKRKLELNRQTTLLEVGCGAGAFTKGLASDTARTVGADFSLGMVRRARQLHIPRAEFTVAEASCLPYGSSLFDRVLCYSVFNNFPSHAYAQQVVEELIRVTKPGGLVLIGQVPNAERKKEWHRTYSARFGGPRRSAARWWLGSIKQMLVQALRRVASLAGKPPQAALHFLYYRPDFFPAMLVGGPHRCDVRPGYNLLRAAGDAATYDYRLDVVITVGTKS